MDSKIKTLKNLQRIAKHHVEVVQKELGQVLGIIQQLEQKIITLEKTLKAEAKLADQDVELMKSYDRFAQRTKTDILKYTQEKQTQRQHEAHLRDKLADCFAEEKRYQILLERKQKELKKHREKKQQQQLDEIAASQFNNK